MDIDERISADWLIIRNNIKRFQVFCKVLSLVSGTKTVLNIKIHRNFVLDFFGAFFNFKNKIKINYFKNMSREEYFVLRFATTGKLSSEYNCESI